MGTFEKRMLTLCESAVYGVEVASTTGAKWNGCRDGRGGSVVDYDGYGYDISATGRGNGLWDPLDDQRLLAMEKREEAMEADI